MQKWGNATTVLAALAVLLPAGILTQQILERRASAVAEPGAGEPSGGTSLDTRRLELEIERERIELEALRLKAQIQADLARAETGLSSLVQPPDDPRKGEALVDAILEFAEDEEKIVRAERTEPELAPAPIPTAELQPISYGSGVGYGSALRSR